MKKITSLTLGFSFLIMSYTGIMLFLSPKGKIAYWSDWELLGLTKEQYGDLHTTSMFVFLIFGSLHIYYNWKPIVSYLKDKTHTISITKKEFVIALSINILFVIGTLAAIPPFQTIIDFNDDIKAYWEKTYGSPPYGHAEESKLKVFVRKVGVNIDDARKALSAKEILFDEYESLKEIAKNNGISPNEIYLIIKNSASMKKTSSRNIPSMLGRKTLEELADMRVIHLEEAFSILREKGLDGISKDSRMKNIADELSLRPIEVFELIEKEDR